MNARDIFGVWMSPETGKRFVISAAGIEFFVVRYEDAQGSHAPTYTKADMIALIERWGWVKA